MKTTVKSFACCLFVAVLTVSCAGNPKNAVSLIQVDPLKKVFKEQLYFEETPDTIAVARGETASFQLVFRSTVPVKGLSFDAGVLEKDGCAIEPSLKAFVGYVYVPERFMSADPSDKRLTSVSGYYPDPLWETETVDADALSNQPLWIGYRIPDEAEAGIYTARITVTGSAGGRKFRMVKEVAAKVCDVTLREQTLYVDNWINPYPQELRRMNGGELFPLYSDKYWELNKAIANRMRDYGQNVYRVFPLQDGNWSICGETEDGLPLYDFNFRHFDESVEFYMEEGGLKLITGYHLGQRLTPGWYSHPGIMVPQVSGRDTVMNILPFDSPEARNFLNQFIPALDTHLKEKGWSDIYLQYLADEPADGEYEDTYLEIADYIKGLAPDLKIIDALHRTPRIVRKIDVPVCILDRLHLQWDGLYEEMIADGREVWFYTCMEPLGNYANRFIEQPLIQTRLLHWINYRYGVKGYLHWGLNSWRNDRIYGENIDWGNSPAGDCWIIYPDCGKVHPSLRLEAMRDGINDYTLLKMIEEKDPAKAREFAAETVLDFDRYDNDIYNLRQRRIKMLEYLGKDEKPRLKREDSFLGVHFDFHAGPDCTEIGKNTTVEMVQDVIDTVNPDFIQIDCKGHPGYSSYPTEVGNRAPGIIGDPLKTWRRVTAENGVALYMHYSGVWDGRACELHPEWAIVDRDGKRSDKITSVFGPYCDSLMIPQLKELAGKYGVDGVWVDGECWGTAPDYGDRAVKMFREATGIASVPRCEADPGWLEWKQFHRDAFKQYVRHYLSGVKSEYPGLQICSNWAFSHHMSEPVSAAVDFLSGDYAPKNSVNSARIAGRYLASQGMPWDLMAWSFTFDNGPKDQKPAIQLQREASVAIALGGGIQVYFMQNRDGSIKSEQLETMREVADFVRKRQPYCHHSSQIPQVALLLSTFDYRHYNSPEDPSWLYPDYKGKAPGILQCLLDSHYSVDVLGEGTLAPVMGRFPMVVVPECDTLSSVFIDDLLNYASKGGSLLVIGEKMCRGISRAAGLPFSGKTGTVVFGDGRIGFWPDSISERYDRDRDPAIRGKMKAIVRELFPNPVAEIEGDSFVDVSVGRKDGRMMVHLVNVSGNHRDAELIDSIRPEGPLEIRVRCPEKPEKILLQPYGRECSFSYRDGCACLTLHTLEIYDILEIVF